MKENTNSRIIYHNTVGNCWQLFQIAYKANATASEHLVTEKVGKGFRFLEILANISPSIFTTVATVVKFGQRGKRQIWMNRSNHHTKRLQKELEKLNFLNQ